MKLNLTSHTTIKDVKKQFSSFFPFLKLEFYTSGHRKEESSILERPVSEGTKLSELSSVIKNTVFSFAPSITVAEFEQRMQRECGLPVQVFRKTGNLWLETVQTDNLPLGKQNSMGEKDAKPVRFNIHTLFL